MADYYQIPLSGYNAATMTTTTNRSISCQVIAESIYLWEDARWASLWMCLLTQVLPFLYLLYLLSDLIKSALGPGHHSILLSWSISTLLTPPSAWGAPLPPVSGRHGGGGENESLSGASPNTRTTYYSPLLEILTKNTAVFQIGLTLMLSNIEIVVS